MASKTSTDARYKRQLLPPRPPGVPEDDDRIYIPQLVHIINRKAGTIRKWEREGKLPKHLLPRRGYRKWRCWTHAQVFGDRGLMKWMKTHDMRPGNLVTPEDGEDAHVANLRRPKYINGHHMRSARVQIEKGRTALQIARKIHKAEIKKGTSPWYSSEENTETALRKAFVCEDGKNHRFPPHVNPMKGIKIPKISTKL